MPMGKQRTGWSHDTAARRLHSTSSRPCTSVAACEAVTCQKRKTLYCRFDCRARLLTWEGPAPCTFGLELAHPIAAALVWLYGCWRLSSRQQLCGACVLQYHSCCRECTPGSQSLAGLPCWAHGSPAKPTNASAAACKHPTNTGCEHVDSADGCNTGVTAQLLTNSALGGSRSDGLLPSLVTCKQWRGVCDDGGCQPKVLHGQPQRGARSPLARGVASRRCEGACL